MINNRYCPLCGKLKCDGDCQDKKQKPKIRKKNPKKKLKWTPNGVQWDE